MKPEAPDGQFFSLVVEGYEFPEEALSPAAGIHADGFETERFLIVSRSLGKSDGEWSARGPTTTCVYRCEGNFFASLVDRQTILSKPRGPLAKIA